MRHLLTRAVTDATAFMALVVWLMAYGALRDRNTWEAQTDVFAPLVAHMDTWQVSVGLYVAPLVFVALVIHRFVPRGKK